MHFFERKYHLFPWPSSHPAWCLSKTLTLNIPDNASIIIALSHCCSAFENLVTSFCPSAMTLVKLLVITSEKSHWLHNVSYLHFGWYCSRSTCCFPRIQQSTHAPVSRQLFFVLALLMFTTFCMSFIQWRKLFFLRHNCYFPRSSNNNNNNYYKLRAIVCTRSKYVPTLTPSSFHIFLLIQTVNLRASSRMQ